MSDPYTHFGTSIIEHVSDDDSWMRAERIPVSADPNRTQVPRYCDFPSCREPLAQANTIGLCRKHYISHAPKGSKKKRGRRS